MLKLPVISAHDYSKWNLFYQRILVLLLIIVFCQPCLKGQGMEQHVMPALPVKVLDLEKERVLRLVDQYWDEAPQSITDRVCERSAGGRNDFYSEGDYWWPDPNNPGGPYIRKDGQSNPGNFSAHRHAMIRMSKITGVMASAYLLTGHEKYAQKAMEHLRVWFIDPSTRMNPHMRYSQAIMGRYTGRGIGLIDAIHLVEPALTIKTIEGSDALSGEELKTLKSWYSEFLDWMVTHEYGKDEMVHPNNHGTCWALQAAAYATLTGNEEMLSFAAQRYKEVLLPDQMAENGSFPLELQRTKPYGYSIFNLDAMSALVQVLSLQGEDLYGYQTSDGRYLKSGMEFLFPYIQEKEKWPFPQDILYFDDYPVQQAFLLFGGLAYDRPEYTELWMELDSDPDKAEVVRNTIVKNPLLWFGLDIPGPGAQRTKVLANKEEANTNITARQTEIIFLSGTDAANTVEWDFYCTGGRNSGEWTKIDVPSNWELEGFGTYNYGHDWKNKEIELGREHGLYKHEFDVPRKWKGKTVHIVFDGSMTDTKVKINGRLAGEIHQGAFYRFKYDITDLLQYGKTNLLEVDVAKHSSNESVNKAERQADFWIFGGIFRPVFLEVLPGIHMKRTAIDAKADGSFTSLVELNRSKDDYQITVVLFDLEGNKIPGNIETDIVKGKTETWISGKFENIKAWNPEWPHLYDVHISLKRGSKTIHKVTERIGFRTVELREHDGFYINGGKVMFKGVNRHSFWPETGRCLSEENHLTDIRLMKEMNMNAVRSSHYVPDKRFIELCDSLGLFVLDEVTGWQDGYDTIVGPKLIRETVFKDENHPSVIIWNHGNEGGWNFSSEKYFNTYDIQQRPVLYPWLLRNGVDTRHYIEFDYGIGRYTYGNDPFMPTELLHGLYDGGHGAGLEAYWRNYEASPLAAGGFLWVLADEAILRTDKPGTVYDSDGNNAPDGILGPHREKEGSFFTIKEIWSPVQIKPIIINRKWDGKLFIENKYFFTNLTDCSFKWQAFGTGIGSSDKKLLGSGIVASPDAEPGETVAVSIDCSNALQDADIFQFAAVDPHGKELYSWSWPVVQPDEKTEELLSNTESRDEVKIVEDKNTVTATASGIGVTFSKQDGLLQSVNTSGKTVSLHGGPVPAGVDTEVTNTWWGKDSDGNFRMTIETSNYPSKITWTLMKNGLLSMEASPLSKRIRDVDFVGISFNYPEEKCEAVTWMGRGPYRVWKNRLKGSNFGVWEKQYNNTVTGESFNQLIYPEFKGYHANLFWATLETEESDFTIVSETPNLFFGLFTPQKPKHVRGDTYPSFPEGDLSFLYEIPAIGTKFKSASKLGPGSQKGTYGGHRGDTFYPIKLWFDFR